MPDPKPNPMTDTLRILILEEAGENAGSLERELRRSEVRFLSRSSASRAEVLQGLDQFAPDVIPAAPPPAGFDALQALQLAQERAPHAPFLIVTGGLNEETAAECMKAGAADY